MVKVIDHLIKVGFVDRNVNPNDRREHFIVLTKKGLKQTAEIVKAFNALDAEIFSGIHKEDQAVFHKVMCQLSTKLKELPATDLFFNYKKTARKKKNTIITKL